VGIDATWANPRAAVGRSITTSGRGPRLSTLVTLQYAGSISQRRECNQPKRRTVWEDGPGTGGMPKGGEDADRSPRGRRPARSATGRGKKPAVTASSAGRTPITSPPRPVSGRSWSSSGSVLGKTIHSRGRADTIDPTGYTTVDSAPCNNDTPLLRLTLPITLDAVSLKSWVRRVSGDTCGN